MCSNALHNRRRRRRDQHPRGDHAAVGAGRAGVETATAGRWVAGESDDLRVRCFAGLSIRQPGCQREGVKGMTDDPFAAFKEGQPPVDPPAADKKKRKIPPKEGATNGKTAEAAPAPKKERKARKPRVAKEMRLPISMLLEIGSLSEEESGALLSI